MYRPVLREETFAVIAALPDGSIDLFHKNAKALFAEKSFNEMKKINLGNSGKIIQQKSKGQFKAEKKFDIPASIFAQSSPFKSPLVVQLELTNRCNLSCKFCFNKAGKPREDEMEIGEFKRIICQLKDQEVLSLFFTGGEPTLHPDFVEMVNYAFGLGLDCFVLTNGTKLDAKLLKQIPNRVYFVMSFDGIDSHFNSHGGLDFLSVKERFKLLKKYDFPFAAQYVLQKRNIVDLEKTYQWCGENEIDLAAIDLYPTGRALANPDLFLTDCDSEKMVRLAQAKFNYEQIQATWVDNRIDVPNPFYFSFIARLEEIFERTFSGTFFAFIASDGVVYPDNWHAGEGMFPGGNIRRQDLAEIWNRGFEKIRELCRWKNFSCCKSCSLSKYYCDFRLPVLSYNLHGNYNSCGAQKVHRDLMLKRIRLRKKMKNILSPDEARGKDIW